MSRTWAQIVRGSSPAPSRLNPNAPVFVPQPRCVECGDVAEVCHRCRMYAVYEDGLCGSCVSWDTPSESMCIGLINLGNAARHMPLNCAACALKKKRNTLKKGYVEMEEILAGQRVTAEQFFDAVRCADQENDEEGPLPSQDIKKLSKALLSRALSDVDDARKMLSRRVRAYGGIWTEDDEEQMDAMNAYAQAVVDEMRRR